MPSAGFEPTISKIECLQKYFFGLIATRIDTYYTLGVQVLRSPNFFLGMEADRNMKVVGGDVAVL